MTRALLALAGLWLCAAPALGQISINADVSKSDVTIDEQIALSVTVSGPEASLPEPRLPALANLSIYDSGRSQNLSIVNGAVSSAIVYTYVVVPRAVGKTVIPPISLTYKGQTVQTQPIEITVRKPDSGMPGAPSMPRATAQQPRGQPGSRSPDVFVTAAVDKKKPYVNEQVTLTVRFYTAVSLLQSPQYQPPAASGFLAEDLPPERHGQTAVRGRTYYFSEIRTALFPAQAGRLTIGPASVRAALPAAAPVDPFSPDFFDRFFQQGGGGREIQLNSDAISVAAEPLPEAGKPAGFSGAVGHFSISAAVDRPRAKAGEAVNLTVTILGEGNLKTVGTPTMPEMPQLRAFDTVSSLNLDKSGDVVHGSKVFKTVLVPRVSGKVTIPPIRFDYFDPRRRAYARAESAPIALDIAPGDASAAGPSAPAGPSPASPRGVTAVSQDLRYLKTAPTQGWATRALEGLALAGGVNAVPFVIFLAILGLAQYRRMASADPAGARARRALRAAQARIQRSRGAGPGEAAARLSEALTWYLADKLGQPASSLTPKRAQEFVRERKPDAPVELLDGMRALWDDLDMARFAPASDGGDRAALADRVSALLARMDREVFR